MTGPEATKIVSRMQKILRSVQQVPSDFSPSQLRKMPYPKSVLMCAPDYFDVIDVKNPFMESQRGRVDRRKARREWEDLKLAFERLGATVELISPERDREDMVFCANQTFAGLGAQNERVCVLSHMKHPSRQKEVPAFARWFGHRGGRVEAVRPASARFEGGGDAIWHPGAALIWGGVGPRTEAEVYYDVAEKFGAPVALLKLRTDVFYHLDTCFCAIDTQTVMIYAKAFEESGLRLIRRIFPRVIEIPDDEAEKGMAGNATAFFGRHVVIQRGNRITVRALERLGYDVVEVATDEFIKSGGSVYCLKLALF